MSDYGTEVEDNARNSMGLRREAVRFLTIALNLSGC